jgi:hypothetical protein
MATVDLAWQPSLLDAPVVEMDRSFATLCRRELAAGAWVDHAPGWCLGADVLFARILDEAPWSGRSVRMYDRTVPEPRLTHRWRLDEGPAPPVELAAMAEVLSERYGVAFTQVIVKQAPPPSMGIDLTNQRPVPYPIKISFRLRSETSEAGSAHSAAGQSSLVTGRLAVG